MKCEYSLCMHVIDLIIKWYQYRFLDFDDFIVVIM